jgi:hypothetical protein
MFLAHFSNTSIPVLLDMELDELMMWHKAALAVHKHLNTPKKDG